MKFNWAFLLKSKKLMVAVATLIIVVIHSLLTASGVNTTLYMEPLKDVLFALVEVLVGGEL